MLIAHSRLAVAAMHDLKTEAPPSSGLLRTKALTSAKPNQLVNIPEHLKEKRTGLPLILTMRKRSPGMQEKLKSQQASSDERLLDFSQGGRVQVHVGNGLLDQLTSDGEPLLSRC